MKILAEVTLNASADIATIQRLVTDEIRCSWALYAANVLREIYLTDNPRRVVFVLEAADFDAATNRLQTLPLVKSGLFTCALTELRPFTNWSKLFASQAQV